MSGKQFLKQLHPIQVVEYEIYDYLCLSDTASRARIIDHIHWRYRQIHDNDMLRKRIESDLQDVFSSAYSILHHDWSIIWRPRYGVYALTGDGVDLFEQHVGHDKLEQYYDALTELGLL